MLRDKFRKARFVDRKLALLQAADQACVGIERDGAKALRCRRAGRKQAEMGHPGITDDGFRHVPAVASAPSLRNMRLSQMSFDRSVGRRASHSALKCSYSSAQVGSS